jgi:hypothetical protein
MKFQVTMKDPDVLSDAIADAAHKESRIQGLSEREAAAVQNVKIDVMQTVAGEWFQYGEYLTVEVDTDAGTCVVVRPER